MFNRNNVEAFKQRYPAGTRILLEKMDDPYAPVPPGTRGTVILADDAGQLQMKWDNGRTLALIPGKFAPMEMTDPEELKARIRGQAIPELNPEEGDIDEQT